MVTEIPCHVEQLVRSHHATTINRSQRSTRGWTKHSYRFAAMPINESLACAGSRTLSRHQLRMDIRFKE